MRKRVIMSFTFLLIGVLIYLAFYFKIINKSNSILLLTRNYFPDMCWTISFFLISINFTAKLSKNDLMVNSLYVLMIALSYELLQYFEIINGTFDIFDIIVYSISIIFACFIEKELRRRENEKSL